MSNDKEAFERAMGFLLLLRRINKNLKTMLLLLTEQWKKEQLF
jgi:hypothetical protein